MEHYPVGTGHDPSGTVLQWRGEPVPQWCSHSQWTPVRDCFMGMMGPNVAQENIAHTIILLPLACICPTAHPGAIATIGNCHICTWISMWWYIKCDLSGQTTFFHSSMVQLQCSLAHCKHYCWWHATSIGTWLGWLLHRPICTRLHCTVLWGTLSWSSLL